MLHIDCSGIRVKGHGTVSRAKFGPIAELLGSNESRINEELIAVQGHAVDIGGYYMPDESKTSRIMRSSETLNGILGGLARE